MSQVFTYQCDVCEAKTEKTYRPLWAKLTDMNGLEHEVCDECLTHLFTRHPARKGAKGANHDR